MIRRTMTILTTALGLTISAHAQYGPVENFYQADPDFNTGQYAGRIVNPAYWLVNQNRWSEMDSRLISAGYVRLGTSSWESDNQLGGGVPLKQVALGYAQAIGADVVIYSLSAGDKYDFTNHTVGFYAKPNVLRASPANNRPSGAQATAAINRFQDAHHEPRLQHVVNRGALRFFRAQSPKNNFPKSQFSLFPARPKDALLTPPHRVYSFSGSQMQWGVRVPV